MTLPNLENLLEKEELYQHVDGDEFYPSIERSRDKRLIGRPLLTVHGTVVSAASYEAKKLGLLPGMPLFMAEEQIYGRQLPVIILEEDMVKYREVSNAMMNIAAENYPEIDIYSIDEAFGRFRDADWKELNRIGSRIMERVRRELGITVKVGNGYSKYSAKMITSHFGHNQMNTCIDREDYAEKFHHMPVRQLHGVGPASERLLRRSGIKSISQLATSEYGLLRTFFGTETSRGLIERAQGTYHWNFGNNERGTYGRTISVPPLARKNEAIIMNYIGVVADTVSEELMQDNVSGRVVIAGIRTMPEGNINRQAQQTLNSYTYSPENIRRVSQYLFEQLYEREGQPWISRVGVKVQQLKKNIPEQLEMAV